MLQAIELRIERRIKASLPTVWACITTPELIAHWFFTVDFRPVAGHRFAITGASVPGWRGWTNVEVLEIEPPHRMVWKFDCVEEAPPSRVTFDLREEDGAVRLILTHEGEVPARTRQLLKEGWSSYLPRLAGLAAKISS